MKHSIFALLSLLVLILFMCSCADPVIEELARPTLRIKIRDDSGRVVQGVAVKLYKNSNDVGVTKMVDSTGLVVFSELDVALYYWLAEKGCKTNRISQVSLDRPLVPGAIHYGYSVIAETGTLKIINNSTQPYKFSDSVVNTMVSKDTPYIAARRVKTYLVHSENSSTPGIGKDTTIRVKCSDTTILVLPY